MTQQEWNVIWHQALEQLQKRLLPAVLTPIGPEARLAGVCLSYAATKAFPHGTTDVAAVANVLYDYVKADVADVVEGRKSKSEFAWDKKPRVLEAHERNIRKEARQFDGSREQQRVLEGSKPAVVESIEEAYKIADSFPVFDPRGALLRNYIESQVKLDVPKKVILAIVSMALQETNVAQLRKLLNANATTYNPTSFVAGGRR